ncbi:hypothetical protein FDZ71_04765, partial [bacterium]
MAKEKARTKILASGLAVLALLAGAANCRAQAADPQRAEKLLMERLKLKSLLEEKHEARLLSFYADKAEPAPLRALALEAVFSPKAFPLSVTDRATLSEALLNPEPQVRLMAAKLIGRIKETNLIRQVLELADLDPDPEVKAEALVSARPWTRLTHLYFLEKAVESESEKVRVEAVNSLASLSAVELNPAMMAKVRSFSRPGQPDSLRKAAIGALYRWKSLEWGDLRE